MGMLDFVKVDSNFLPIRDLEALDRARKTLSPHSTEPYIQMQTRDLYELMFTLSICKEEFGQIYYESSRSGTLHPLPLTATFRVHTMADETVFEYVVVAENGTVTSFQPYRMYKDSLPVVEAMVTDRSTEDEMEEQLRSMEAIARLRQKPE